MFPLLLIALAALALSQQKKSTGSPASPGASPAPGTGGGVVGPITVGNVPSSSSALAACDFDQSIPPLLRDQAVALINQAQSADASVAGPLATSLDTLGTTAEMSGLPKTAACLRNASQFLRQKYSLGMGPSLLPLGPVSAGLAQASPVLVNVIPKPKDTFEVKA